MKEATERFAQNVIEPLFRAIPGVNIAYILGDIQKAGDAIDDVKGKGANALEAVVREARTLYEDIQGPSRTLSSLILGLGNYVQHIQQKIDKNETLTPEDITAVNLYKEIGRDYGTAPSKETPQRAAARGIATDLIKTLREDPTESTPIDLPDKMKQFLSGAERKELADEQQGGIIDLLLKERQTQEGGTRKYHRKKTLTSSRHRGRGTKKTKRRSRT